MPPPTAKENWIAEFATYMVVKAVPSRGEKFAMLVAAREWNRRGDLTGEDAAKRWLKAQEKAR